MEAKEQGRMKEEWCRSWVGADAKDEDDGLHGTNCAHLIHKAAPEADIYVAKVFKQNAFRFYETENIASVGQPRNGSRRGVGMLTLAT